jgi:ABC-type transporter Mla MlaB component
MEGDDAMLKISEAGREQDSITLKLEGRVVGPWVHELGIVTDDARLKGLSVVLDLSGVEFIDRGGVALFSLLAERKVTLIHCPRFVVELLKEVSSCQS